MPLKLSTAVWQTTPAWRYLDPANAEKQPWLGKLLKSAPNFWQRKYQPHKKAAPKCAYTVADADPLRLKIVSPTQVLVVGIYMRKVGLACSSIMDRARRSLIQSVGSIPLYMQATQNCAQST